MCCLVICVTCNLNHLKKTDFSSGEHVVHVNFAVAQYADGTEFVFKGYLALHEFCDFVFSMKHKGYSLLILYSFIMELMGRT
jgi:hypothetical protein